jgi:pilus assembly protein Flp/PilA
VGETQQTGGLSHASGRRAAGRLAARFDLKRFWRDQSGATAVEYGLICACIFLVIVTSVTAFGNKTTDIMNAVSTAISDAIGG